MDLRLVPVQKRHFFEVSAPLRLCVIYLPLCAFLCLFVAIFSPLSLGGSIVFQD